MKVILKTFSKKTITFDNVQSFKINRYWFSITDCDGILQYDQEHVTEFNSIEVLDDD